MVKPKAKNQKITEGETQSHYSQLVDNIKHYNEILE